MKLKKLKKQLDECYGARPDVEYYDGDMYTEVEMDVSVCEKEIRGFLDKEQKLHTYPAKFKKQLFAL